MNKRKERRPTRSAILIGKMYLYVSYKIACHKVYFENPQHKHEAEKANLWYRIIFLFLLQPDSSNESVGLDYQDDLYFIYVICGSFGFPNIHQFLNTDPSKTLCVNHCIICNDSFLTSQLINRRPYKLSNEKILLS